METIKKHRKDMVDLTGRKFGRLTVLKIGTPGRRPVWICQCDCGKIKEVPSCALLSGATKSCGCIRKENMYAKTRLYHIWNCMKGRSHHKTVKSKDYYDKGITLCKEWEEFTNFKDWAYKNGYADNLTIDRIDNNKGYFPDNCRWATPKQQANNRKTCVYITFNDKTQTFSEWCEEYRLSKVTVNAYRMYHNISHKDAILHYINKNNNGTI